MRDDGGVSLSATNVIGDGESVCCSFFAEGGCYDAAGRGI